MDEKRTQQGIAYVDSILDRLIESYLARGPIPDNEHRQFDGTLLHRLAFAVVAEGYGADSMSRNQRTYQDEQRHA